MLLLRAGMGWARNLEGRTDDEQATFGRINSLTFYGVVAVAATNPTFYHRLGVSGTGRERAVTSGVPSQAEAASPRPTLRLALYQPERPHNFGAVLRLCACLGVTLDVIEPCGFPLDDRRIRQAALDYAHRADWVRHMDFGRFEQLRLAQRRRLVLLTTRGDRPHHRITYRVDDVLMLGRESCGVPTAVAAGADLRVRIPMRAGLRSLNLAVAAAIVLGEALRQTGGFGESPPARGDLA